MAKSAIKELSKGIIQPKKKKIFRGIPTQGMVKDIATVSIDEPLSRGRITDVATPPPIPPAPNVPQVGIAPQVPEVAPIAPLTPTQEAERSLQEAIAGFQGLPMQSQFDLALQQILFNQISPQVNAPTIQAGREVASDLVALPEALADVQGFQQLNLNQARRLAQIEEAGLTNLFQGISGTLEARRSRLDKLSELAGQALTEETQRTRDLVSLREAELNRAIQSEQQAFTNDLAIADFQQTALPYGQIAQIGDRTIVGQALPEQPTIKAIANPTGGIVFYDDSGNILQKIDSFGNVLSGDGTLGGPSSSITYGNIPDTPIATIDLGGKQVTAQQQFLNGLQQADAEFFAATGKHIQVNQDFRTLENQKAIRAEFGYTSDSQPSGYNGLPLAAPPGTSFHERGLAIDVSNWQEVAPYLKKYGIVNGLAGDMGHFSMGELNPEIFGASKVTFDSALQEAAKRGFTGNKAIEFANLAVQNQFYPKKQFTDLESSVQGKVLDGKSLLNLSNQALQLGEEQGWSGVGGLYKGSLNQFLAKQFGSGSSEEQQLRNLIGNIKATVARQRGGTSFTANEQVLLETYTPTIDDSPLVIQSKLKSLNDFLNNQITDVVNIYGVDLSNFGFNIQPNPTAFTNISSTTSLTITKPSVTEKKKSTKSNFVESILGQIKGIASKGMSNEDKAKNLFLTD